AASSLTASSDPRPPRALPSSPTRRSSDLKVVLSRRVRVDCADAIDAGALLARLDGAAVTRFLFRRGDAAFIGATPERLKRKRVTDRKSTRLNSRHSPISYAPFSL